MQHINQVVSTSTRERCSEHSTRTSDLTNIEKELVRRFFARLQTIYGTQRYASAFPDASAEKAAMREWARDIVKYSQQQLEAKLQAAKGNMGRREWAWPDIGLILNGEDSKVVEAGQAALSYRPVDEVVGLPAPGRDKAAGRAALAKIRAGL